MDELKKLYDVLVREGKYTKSFDEFQAKWSQDEEYKNKVYDVVSRDGLYTKDKNSFFQKYSVSAPEEAPVKQEIPQPSKKKFALDSSLEGGSSVSQPSPKKSTLPEKMPELTEEGFTQAVKKMKETHQDMSGKPLIKPLSEEQKSFLKKSAEEKKTEAVERKKLGEVFDKQLGVKPKVEESEYLNERLSSINTDLMNQTEENVVAEMQYQFGDLGFKFEPSGYLGDYMIVTSPDGKKTKEVSLDNFLNSKSSREANDLKKFIKENTPAKGLFVIENSLKEKDKKFNSEKEVEFETKKISTSLNELNARQKNVIQRRNALAKEYEALSKVPMSERNTQDFKDKVDLLEQKKLQIDEDVKLVLKDEENLKIKSSQLNRAVAKYTLTKQKQGGFFGALRDSFFRGIGSMSSGITNAVIDLSTELQPAGFGMSPEDLKEISVDIAKKIGVKGPSANQTLEQWKSTLTEDQLDNWEDEVDDYIKKDLKSQLLPAIRIGAEEIFGDPETTKQWSDLNKQGFWTGALLGLSQSLPAMIGGGGIAGWAQRTAQMYAQVTDNINEEMQNDSDFKNISENEKLAITLPIGITSAVLEAYGLRNVMASKGLINSITMSVLNKSGRNISAKTFRELVQDEVESRIARGLLIMGAAGLAEAETGAAQELTETSFKALYNKIKEKEMFRTPESTMDLLENVVVAGAQEAVGGFILGLPSGVGVAYSKKGFLNMSDDAFNAFEEIANDDKIQSAYIASLKNKITSGELTTQEAKDELNNYRNSVGLYRQLPDGLTTQQKKEAMNLLKERKDLENYINGKDAALVVKQKNRIQEINDLLTNLTEEDAIQKQTTDESVLRTKQPEVELQGVGEGNAKLEGLTTEKEIADAKQKFIETSIERKGSELSKDELNYIDSIFDEKLKSLKKPEEVDALRDEESTATALGNLDIPWFDDFQSNFGENYKTVNDVSESYHKAKEDGSNPELVKAVESLLTPKATEQVTEQVTEEEVIPSTPISEALNDVSGVYVYDGKKGQLTTIGQTVVLETPTEIIDLGNVDELSDSTLADFGIQKEAELDITLNDDNSVVVGGKTYVNNYSTPDAAISQDKDGNYSVTLDTENGQKRTFRGQQADQIVYQMKLKNFEENGTEQQIDNAIELADEAIRVEEETREPSTEREGKTVRKGKRKQRTLKTVKEPLTKAEREAEVKPQEIEVVTETAPAEELTQQQIDDYNEAVRQGDIDESLISELEAENIYQAYRDMEAKMEIVRLGEEGAMDMYMFIHNNLGRIRPSDFDQYGDRNVRKDIKGFNIKYSDKKATPLDVRTQEMSEQFGFEITPQDVIDYILDRESNPDKYLKSKLKKLNESASIKFTPEKGYEVYMNLKNDAKSMKALDALAGKALSYEQVEIIKKHLKEKYGKADTTADTSVQRTNEAAKRSEAEKSTTKPSETKVDEVKDLLDVDTKEKSGLKRVVDFLDRIDESLKLDPNELNDVTRVMAIGTAKVIVKTLRALVNAGITLQEAIKRTAEIHSIKADKIIDALDIMSKIVENKSEGISEMELPGYNALSSDIDSQIKDGKTVDEVISSVQKTDTYKNATDVQKELLVRNIRKRFGLREKSAPSVARLFGQLKDIKKITMTEKALFLQTMKDKAKTYKDTVKDYKQMAQEIADGLKELKASGKITSNQVTNILSQFAKVNMFSHKSVSKFVDYTTKILKDADYNSKIKTAKGLRSDIKQLSKNKEKNANLRDLAAEFAKIDPSMVEDIDAYNQKAAEVKRAVSGSKRRGANVKFAETVNIKDTYSYVKKTLEEQAEAIRKEKIAEIKELMNTDAEQFTDAEIDALLQPDADTDKYSEDIARAAIKKAFDLYSTLIKKSVKDGKTIFTEEDVDYTDSQKKVIEKFMAMDTDNMSTKDALNAVDSLINFLENQSTANMETVVQRYEGQQAIKQLKKKGIKAKALTKFGLKSFGRFLGDQTTNLNILFEKMFIGFNRASSVMKDMGLTELINKYAYAKNLSNKITTIYVAKFYDKKANGQKFNTLFNNIERGMSAFMMRTVIGTEAEMEADFKRRKGLIEQSIDALSEGTKDEKKLADTYREVYDKILEDSKTIEDVTSKTDKVNLLAIEFWQERWSEKWDQMSDVATNVYNKNLKRELNYTPDRYSNLESNTESVNLENSDSAFISNTSGSLYKKESASLMDVTGNDKLPVDNESKKAKSYIDLSFDKNNSNSMYDALVDIETAAPIRKIQAFMNSPEFKDVFGEDADLIKGSKGSVGRVQQYVNNIRNKNPFSNDELSKALKKLNKIASLGVAQALGGPTAIIKQTVPVMLSTMVNTNGSFDAKAAMDKDFMNWLKDSGYAISTRGVESQADIESINKLIEQAAESNYDKAMNLLENLNNFWLKTFLVNGDRWVAISSWKTYYEQSLKDRGLYKTTNITKTASGERIVETKGIDYSNHKVDETAADYAQKMVDRQQNISDSNMAGSLFSSKDTLKQVIVKTIMPFASFRMNQGSRIGADLRVLSNWKTADKEDRAVAIRSLMGYGVETVTFRALQAGISILLYNITTSIMDRDDDEEERKKMKDRIYKGAATNIVGEVLSPMPIFDKLVQGGAAYVLESVQNGLEIPEEEKVALYKMGKEDFIKNLGTFGVTAGRAMELYELISMSVTGEYEDNYGKKRKISEENREALDDFIGPLVISSLSGFSAPEMSSVARNAMRIAKKKYLTEEEKFIKQEKEIKEQEIKDIKLDALDRVIAKATNENVRREAENLYYELTVTDKEEISRIEENKKYEKEAIKDLLIDPVTGMEYSNVSDLKQYNKNLWVKNFGPNSEWYKENKFKKEVEKRLREELKKEKDKKYKR